MSHILPVPLEMQLPSADQVYHAGQLPQKGGSYGLEESRKIGCAAKTADLQHTVVCVLAATQLRAALDFAVCGQRCVLRGRERRVMDYAHAPVRVARPAFLKEPLIEAQTQRDPCSQPTLGTGLHDTMEAEHAQVKLDGHPWSSKLRQCDRVFVNVRMLRTC